MFTISEFSGFFTKKHVADETFSLRMPEMLLRRELAAMYGQPIELLSCVRTSTGVREARRDAPTFTQTERRWHRQSENVRVRERYVELDAIAGPFGAPGDMRQVRAICRVYDATESCAT